MASPYTFDLADSPPQRAFTSDSDNPLVPLPFETAISSGHPESSLSLSSQSFPTSLESPLGINIHQTALGRRRHRSNSPDILEPSTAGTTVSQNTRVLESAQSPPRKRRRLPTMRADGPSSTNGFSQAPNGSSSRKASSNGQSTVTTANGESRSNGAVTSSTSSTYFGHNREEVTRILIQSLHELGYNDAAAVLSAESGYQLETTGVATFRSAVKPPEKLVLLAPGADMDRMKFCLRQQKFLELLEARDLDAALAVLRDELTPLNYDVDRLHALSSLIMCPIELLHDQANWESPISASRERLLENLSRSISPSVMIPSHRLAVLLDHVQQGQINNCLYHNTAEAPSLYSEHMCDRECFPLEVRIDLTEHSDEVWYCEFSHDGSKLVTAGRDQNVLIYDANRFSVIHRLADHLGGVAFASWSPDDTKLVTCSQDRKARVWNVETGICILTIDHHNQPVTSAAWAPDGESFVTGSFDSTRQLCHWSIHGDNLHMWKGPFRVQDCAISLDGRRLVAAETDAKIHVYDFRTYEEDYYLSLSSKPTSIEISRDSKHLLVSLAEGEVQLIDLDTTAVLRRFKGQMQGEFVIRSNFGGAAENFVVSGSEDSRVFIWHKDNGTLVQTLEGHDKGCVNTISWNPADPTMFASAVGLHLGFITRQAYQANAEDKFPMDFRKQVPSEALTT
ncbi:hypothetical protein N7495_001320 [Penicillium taxi]|uniref:uncharacterized protein n=1 Tax=Penicillium taxi TaxID=168475 RepID=UPI00254523CB|nr:uncharacterized protein N7495_001320 [Penicillium taxi]KAJ5908638.1 hypothetical protein N7495_001320 [Penicillium taxi]